MTLPNTDQGRVPSVVVVDPRFDSYKSLAASARLGRITIHFRSSGADALKLARRIPVDAWLVAPELDDMSGHDLIQLLPSQGVSAGLHSPSIAIVEAADRPVSAGAEQESDAALLSHPITLADLEHLLDLPVDQRSKLLPVGNARRPFVTLPIGVGAAAIAFAILIMG